MEPNQSTNEKQPARRSAFTVMNNVRDHCGQPWARKSLLLLIATYANADGVCWPSNALLARAMHKTERTVQRTLTKLKADGELDVVTVGAGRKSKRIISLPRYAVTGVTLSTNVNGKHDTALSCLNTTQLCHPNSYSEQPHSLKRREGLTPLSRKRDRGAPAIEGLDGLLEEQAEAVLYYNRQLVPIGWLPVTKISPELEKALGIFDPEAIRELVDGILSNSPDVFEPKRKTLVKLCWENYWPMKKLKANPKGSEVLRLLIDLAAIEHPAVVIPERKTLADLIRANPPAEFLRRWRTHNNWPWIFFASSRKGGQAGRSPRLARGGVFFCSEQQQPQH
jgi:hypothetical protein